jgi:hypothetical protein
VIDSSEVSVVVQGPFHPASQGRRGTAEMLSAVRLHLPDAEIILSTWPNQFDGSVPCDCVIENDDPGAIGDRASNSFANLSRQIITSLSGLRRSTRKYALKLRTDCTLTSDNFLGIWEEREPLGLRPALLTRKVMISAATCYNPVRVPIPFHPSDFFHFGVTQDVTKLWEVPLVPTEVAIHFPEGTLSRYWNSVPCESNLPFRTTPEQYLFLEFLARSGFPMTLKGIRSINPLDLLFSDRLMARHFVVVDPFSAGIVLPERFHCNLNSASPFYRNDLDGGAFSATTPIASLMSLVARFPLYCCACIREIIRRILLVPSFLLSRSRI